ncbi:MAG TPA: flavodoxin [Candidatus Lachnoclostridium pullistercoris]|uniref:Flavodoxin n=1 Tax=Candidatus Lachnoclostridium pullistercoris TaxID=2838632 RepID=A0A9D2T602_9FIRM|nr:flavodoxin [Candidatus Lachnoclostridium pullistercoris]
MKIAVIYWSGTGNTEMMAEAVADGARSAGADVDVINVSQTDAADALSYDALALGCPAMGAEQLEESEFEPFFAELESGLKGKKVALFGSHEWSEEGQWMDDWTERTLGDGAVLCGGAGLKVYSVPDEDGLEKCRALGKALAEM